MKPATALLLTLIALATSLPATADEAISQEERMRWFKHDKFGMFIHWGPYSNLAGEWNGQRLRRGQIAEWIMKFLKIPRAEYRELAREFNPVKFDADQWAQLAADTGMKYLVLTTKHHDGFAMYHSRVSKYNIVDWTPFGRDPTRELAAACRRRGIRFCVYYSHREDWDDKDAYGNDWEFDPKDKDFEAYLERKAKPQLRELMTNYGPIGMVWFDRGMYTQQQAQDFKDIVRKAQPRTIVNGRIGNYNKELMGDYQNLSDNGMPPGGVEEYWETPQTLNHTWGYSQFDHDWKSPQELIRRLVEITSKGGNYLLNIGPKGDGSIPVPSLAALEGVGAWMRWNSESIYGATASPFEELRWGRCTVKGNKLYLHVFRWTESGAIDLPGLRTPVKSAYPLLEPEQRLDARNEGTKVIVTLPEHPLDENNTVLVLELDGAPEVDPPVVANDTDEIMLDYAKAVTSGKAVKRFNRGGKFHISKWTGPEDAITWYIDVVHPGKYRARITYAAQEDWAGRKYRISLDGSSLTPTVEHTGEWYEYKVFDIGVIEIPKAGIVPLKISPVANGDNDLMYFKSLELVPAGN